MAGDPGRAGATWASIALLALCAAAWAAFAAVTFGPALISNDGAQYLSIAANIATGQGNATSLLLYEQHFATERIPAPQTVFPAGYSYVTAVLLLSGLPAEWAGFLVSLFCHLTATAILFHLLWRATLAPVGVAAALAIAWLTLAINFSLVTDAMSEPSFVAATLASTWCYWRHLERSEARLGWLLASGVLAAAALHVRYAGLFFIAGAGMAQVVNWLRAPAWRGLLRVVGWGLPSTAVLAFTFWRNYELVGTFQGGPQLHVAHSIAEVAQRFYWATSGTFGWGFGSRIESLAMLAAAVALLVLAITSRRHVAVPEAAAHRPPPGYSALVLWSVAYVAVSLAALTWMSAATPAPVTPRYLQPLWPFVFLALAAWLSERFTTSRSRTLALGSSALLCAALGLGQWHLYHEMSPAAVRSEPRMTLDRILAAERGNATLAACLRALTADGVPVFMNESQQVGVSVGVPTLGVPSEFYAAGVWDTQSVVPLLDQYGVRWILFFPAVYDDQVRRGMDQAPVYAQLRSMDTSPDLVLIGRSSDYVLFARAWTMDRRSLEGALPFECRQGAEANFSFRQQPAS